MHADSQPFAEPEHLPFELGDGAGVALLIHGFPGTPAEMRPIGEALGLNGWRARGILLPGFGPDIVNLSERRRKDWLDAAEAAWLDLRESGHPAILIGYSMGAAVALNLAGSLPPDLLVLISPFWRVAGFLPKLVPALKWVIPKIYPFKKADFSNPDLQALFRQIMPGVDLDDPEVKEWIRSEFGLSLRVIDEILHLGKDAYHNAEQIDVPTLVIQGENDRVVRPADTFQLVRRLRAESVAYHELAGGHDLIQDGSINRSAVNGLILKQASGLQASHQISDKQLD